MTKQHFLKILNNLELTQTEAAKFLSVNIRTIRHWIKNPKKIPERAQQALMAWQQLQQIGIPWRPESVKNCSGTAASWQVDLKNIISLIYRTIQMIYYILSIY